MEFLVGLRANDIKLKTDNNIKTKTSFSITYDIIIQLLQTISYCHLRLIFYSSKTRMHSHSTTKESYMQVTLFSSTLVIKLEIYLLISDSLQTIICRET